MRFVSLTPAHNEQDSIAATIEALLAQERPIDNIVIVCDNCTDDTERVARAYPVSVLVTEGNNYRKSGALNMAWQRYAQDADVVISCDADSQLPPSAVANWQREFEDDVTLGGSSPQVVMTGSNLLARLQRSEFTKSATIGLHRGRVSVISGTGCAYRGAALREIATREDQPDGPWSYESVTEDFYLTYRLREAQWHTQTSREVWCNTGSMPTLRALWHQRVKWQAGTLEDLISFGFNKLTFRDWFLQFVNLSMILYWIFYIALLTREALMTGVSITPAWAICPAIFAFAEIMHSLRIRGRTWHDIVLAVTLLPMFAFSLMNVGWIVTSWRKVLKIKRGRANNLDLWGAQYAAEKSRS